MLGFILSRYIKNLITSLHKGEIIHSTDYVEVSVW